MRILGMPTKEARAYQSGAPDAYGMPPEVRVSDGTANPCRHCLRHVPAGSGMLVLAYRPFGAPQPYAETGPVFLCAEPCAPVAEAEVRDRLPEVLESSPDYLLKGYGADERIVYGTGGIVPREGLAARARQILGDSRVRFVDVRSARNNCWQARILPG